METNELKCTDLRIGNWIKYEDKLVQVVQLSSLMILCQRDENHFLVNCAPKVFDPIELTEELLVTIGFKKGYNEIYSKCLNSDDYEYHISYQNVYDNEYSFVVYGSNKNGALKRRIVLDNIKYLHELQNAYYVLTGKELYEQEIEELKNELKENNIEL